MMSLSNEQATLIERAFALAASGRFRTVGEIRAQLHVEGVSHIELTELSGLTIRRQLRAALNEARKGRAP